MFISINHQHLHRFVGLAITYSGVSSGVMSATLNGTNFHQSQAHKQFGSFGAEIYYLLDHELNEMSGIYPYNVVVDGSSPDLIITPFYFKGIKQEEPINFGISTNTEIEISSNLISNVSENSIIVDCLFNESINKFEEENYQIQSSKHQQLFSIRNISASGKSTSLYSNLSSGFRKILVSLELMKHIPHPNTAQISWSFG